MTVQDSRDAALKAIDKFCAKQGFPVPQLEEREAGSHVHFVGKCPDGREFGIGYKSANSADDKVMTEEGV